MSIADKLITVADNVQKVYDAGYAAGQKAGGGGGGSVDGYATVTFMNGGEVLFSRMVLKGDDCPDPVEQGRIETPTKESAAQYDYTFNGWATADGGSADSNALKGITDDKTLYAAFAESVRMYTVRFYDGDTLLHTEQVAYGGSSGYEYFKEGYKFNGWTPEPTYITGDMDCYGEWEESLEITDSWDAIIAAAKDGTYATKYTVGQYKPLDLGAEGVIRMQIVAKGMDWEYNGLTNDSNAKHIPLTFVAMDLLKTKKKLHETAYPSYDYGWSMSSLRAYLQNSIMPLLPTNVSVAIKPTNKTTYEYTTKQTQLISEERLWIPSYKEVAYSPMGNTMEPNGPSYQDWFYDNATRVRSVAGESGASDWWIRSISRTYAPQYVTTIGSVLARSNGPDVEKGVCIGFCI